MKVDIKHLMESDMFRELVAKALQPFEYAEEHRVQISINIRTEFNTSMAVNVSQDFDLYDHEAETAGETSSESDESKNECCNSSCDCKHEGDGL